MRIGINLLALLPNQSGGIEFYARNLIAALEQIDRDNEYFLFTNLDNHDSFCPASTRFSRLRLSVHARPQWKRIAYEQLRLPFLACSLRLDVLHSPTYTWPVLAQVPGVVTICDMLYLHYPESIERTKLAFWQVFIPWSVRRCRRVLTISNHAGRDIVTGLGIPAEKVVVTPLAVDHSLVQGGLSLEEIDTRLAKYGIQKPYLLYVGGVGRHKNAQILVRALAELRQHPPATGLRVVITGNDYGARREISAVAEGLGLQERVCLPGYIAREDLPAVYQGASVYVSPSLFEGFGLTALEAMAYGVPTIVSDRASLPEVAGDASLVVDPTDASAVANAVLRVMTDRATRNRLVDCGHKRVEHYSWRETARLTLKSYAEAARIAL